jgi:hypothetical protein
MQVYLQRKYVQNVLHWIKFTLNGDENIFKDYFKDIIKF